MQRSRGYQPVTAAASQLEEQRSCRYVALLRLVEAVPAVRVERHPLPAGGLVGAGDEMAVPGGLDRLVAQVRDGRPVAGLEVGGDRRLFGVAIAQVIAAGVGSDGVLVD